MSTFTPPPPCAVSMRDLRVAIACSVDPDDVDAAYTAIMRHAIETGRRGNIRSVLANLAEGVAEMRPDVADLIRSAPTKC